MNSFGIHSIFFRITHKKSLRLIEIIGRKILSFYLVEFVKSF
jgi:hypothetical protein